jgi:SAM-dependent methyltransferase
MPVETERPAVVPDPSAARQRDPWFWSHYESASGIILSELPRDRLGGLRKILDFGCGDGATALGVASRSRAEVVGVDLTDAFRQLPELSKNNLGFDRSPAGLSFIQVEENRPLPVAAGIFDLSYSWSVFEHLSNVKGVLAELHRVTAPNGLLFIQIEPLYHGPFGSHLQRLVDEPWAHLHDEEDFVRRAWAAVDHVPLDEHDVLYRTNTFEDVKRYLIGEYRKLNRITAYELIAWVQEAGFRIVTQKLIKEERLVPTERLLARYPIDLLLTNQLVLVAERERVD